MNTFPPYIVLAIKNIILVCKDPDDTSIIYFVAGTLTLIVINMLFEIYLNRKKA